MTKHLKKFGWWSALLALAFATGALPMRAAAQDDQGDDPPTRVARLGYMEGSVSFQPAGEEDWVQAVPNRPMTTGDKLWADKASRAELQLGSAVIRLSENTGFSFLNLDDRTVQIQLTSGALNLRVRRLDQNDAYEVDTPNLAFTVDGPGNYRLEASEDGTYSVVSLRDGQGEATGNGQTYTIHAGQRATFSGTDSLNANVENIGGPDQFDSWTDGRDHRWENSRSSRYLSRDVVGYEDLDDNGDWRDDSSYGHVWFPSHVEAGWAPYHQGHWDWISPWGYTWVDDSNWGYAPFHYGRWVTVGGRWGWIAGPIDVQPVYAPALVVFLGGGPGGFGAEVGWFPLGPREVYVPPYQVSRGYMNQVNISNTTVNTTVVTNVYNTTIVNKSTTITNVNYANRNVQGAVTVVPQRAFASAQPVARAAVAVNAEQLSRAPIAARVAVAPTRESVLGAKASTAGHVTAPPQAVANRQVIAKRTPPPPPVPFAKQQQAMAAHPGQPIPKREMQSLRPAASAAAHPMVKQAPPGKPATPTTGRPMNAGRPGQPGQQPPANQPGNRPNEPGNRPGNQPNERPGAANPAQQNRPNQPENRPGAQPNQPGNRPEANRPPTGQPNQPGNRPEANRPPAGQPNQPGNRPETNRPPAGQPNQPGNRPEANRPPAGQPNQPNNRPEANRPPAGQPNQPGNRPEPNRPPAAQPNNRPNQPEPARPQPNRPEPPAQSNRPAPAQPNRPAEPPAQSNRPQPNRPEPKPAQPEARPQTPPAAQRAPERTPPPAQSKPAPPPPQQRAPERTPPPAAKPAPPPAQHQQTPQEKKKQQEEEKKKPPVG